MTQKSAIILAIDGLNTSMLPPYGNTLIDTPYFNQLAAQSDTCDFSISDTPDLVAGMRSVWHACHAANPAVQSEHLATRLSTAGVQTVLFTDEPDLSESALAESFDRIIKAESTSPTELATSVDQTWLANFFAQAVACVQQLEPGTLLWIHCRGLFGAWDAPYPIRKQLADEEDPDPPESIEAPKGSFDSKQDSPDVLLGHQQCCAAQLILLDEFLGVLLDQVTMIPSTMLSLMSTRGYPLGEHGQIGQPRELYSEMIHVPLMIRWPETKCGTRIQHLVQRFLP